MIETAVLEELGLTNTEIRVYISLLELGSSSAGLILEKSKLPNSTVHRDLNSLIEKGLINFVMEGKRKVYQATSPENFVNFIDDKKKRFLEILPQLKEKQGSGKKEQQTGVYKGVKGVRELMYELLGAGGSEHHAFGGSSAGLVMGDTFWINYHKKRAEKGIKAKLLFNNSLRDWVEKYKAPKAEYKFTESGFEPLTETIIRNGKVGIIIYTEIPEGILIHNAEAARSYEVFFKMLWDKAKK